MIIFKTCFRELNITVPMIFTSLRGHAKMTSYTQLTKPRKRYIFAHIGAVIFRVESPKVIN